MSTSKRIILIFVSMINMHAFSQNIELSIQNNFRITPIYLAPLSPVVSTPVHVAFQNQDRHLSGKTLSAKLKYFLNKNKMTYIKLETGIRYDHLYYEDAPIGVTEANYGLSINTWMSDVSFGIGRTLHKKEIDDGHRKIDLELDYGFFNRGSDYSSNRSGSREFGRHYQFNPFVLTINYCRNRWNLGIGGVIQIDREVFDFTDEPFILPQLSVGYVVIKSE